MKIAKETVTGFFKAFNEKSGWKDFISEDIIFDNVTEAPPIKGKADFIQQNLLFLGIMESSSLNSIISEGNKVSVTATYNLKSPAGELYVLKTIEIYNVSDGFINHIYIGFDTTCFYQFMANLPKDAACN